MLTGRAALTCEAAVQATMQAFGTGRLDVLGHPLPLQATALLRSGVPVPGGNASAGAAKRNLHLLLPLTARGSV